MIPTYQLREAFAEFPAYSLITGRPGTVRLCGRELNDNALRCSHYPQCGRQLHWGSIMCFSFRRSVLLLESKHLMINRGSLHAKYVPEVCEMSSVTTRADQMLCTRVNNWIQACFVSAEGTFSSNSLFFDRWRRHTFFCILRTLSVVAQCAQAVSARTAE